MLLLLHPIALRLLLALIRAIAAGGAGIGVHVDVCCQRDMVSESLPYKPIPTMWLNKCMCVSHGQGRRLSKTSVRVGVGEGEFEFSGVVET